MLTNTMTAQDNITLTLTPAAQAHFHDLIVREFDTEVVNLRISVTDPGTSKADVGITFCPAGEEEQTDINQSYSGFTLFIEKSAKTALQDAVIDYKTNSFGGELFVKAPYIKGAAFSNEWPLEQRVQHVITHEINPNLASHGGFVSLESIEAGPSIILKFGGGCHGCGMADVTLKSGVEKTLKQFCPEIIAVKDVTDHATGENPYFCDSKE